jgi:hypothetical protein
MGTTGRREIAAKALLWFFVTLYFRGKKQWNGIIGYILSTLSMRKHKIPTQPSHKSDELQSSSARDI